ncbi:hypothetical protein TNCV_3041681 [Trichonephila clavipes]|nr:hypothetical protein TNCV_3041681 [Trichonephila clavipes]
MSKTPRQATSVLTTTPHQQEDSEPLNACYITICKLYHYKTNSRLVSKCLLKEPSGSSTRPIDDRTHSFKWGSREEDDTEGSYPSPKHHASPTGRL